MTQPNDDAIRTWLWMQAMNYACNDIWRSCKNIAIPDENERRFMKFEDLLEKSYRYALNRWDETVRRQSSYSGSGSSENHYSTGCNINSNHKGITAKFKAIEASITWPDVKQFIERLLSPSTMEERQLTMLEILSMEVPK